MRYHARSTQTRVSRNLSTLMGVGSRCTGSAPPTGTSGNGVIEKAPKGKSKRAVPLGSIPVTVLRSPGSPGGREAAAAEIYEDGGGYVFSWEDGRHLALGTPDITARRGT
jgi:hypothetical protein